MGTEVLAPPTCEAVGGRPGICSRPPPPRILKPAGLLAAPAPDKLGTLGRTPRPRPPWSARSHLHRILWHLITGVRSIFNQHKQRETTGKGKGRVPGAEETAGYPQPSVTSRGAVEGSLRTVTRRMVGTGLKPQGRCQRVQPRPAEELVAGRAASGQIRGGRGGVVAPTGSRTEGEETGI